MSFFSLFFPFSLLLLFSWFQKVQIYTRRAPRLKYSPHIRTAIIPNFIFQTSAWPSRPLDSSLPLATSDWYTVVLLRLTFLLVKCHFFPRDKYGFFPLFYFPTDATLQYCRLQSLSLLWRWKVAAAQEASGHRVTLKQFQPDSEGSWKWRTADKEKP